MRICMENNARKLIVYQNDIPAETLVDILLLLPVKSLCRFRCVSKLWRSLISDPSFIARHTNIAVEDKEVFLQRRRVLFEARHSRNSFYELSSIDLYEFLNKDKHDDSLTAAATQIEFDCQEIYPLVYSCNNLLFCKTQNECYLVNPATREKKKILDLTSQTTRFAIYGFGFDDSAGEYKVIAGEESVHRGIVFSVYSLKNDSWRHVKGPFPYLHESAEGVLLNGAVHWLVWTTRDSSLKIISMRITVEEEVQEIQLPPATYDRQLLGVFRDCLCVSSDSYSYSEEYVEFWVMKEYAVYESWTKMRVRIPYKRLSHPGLSFSMPCNRLSHSHELIVFGRDLVLYDFRDDSSSFLSIRGVPEVGRSCVGIYVESLFSLASQESM